MVTAIKLTASTNTFEDKELRVIAVFSLSMLPPIIVTSPVLTVMPYVLLVKIEQFVSSTKP